MGDERKKEKMPRKVGSYPAWGKGNVKASLKRGKAVEKNRPHNATKGRRLLGNSGEGGQNERLGHSGVSNEDCKPKKKSAKWGGNR